MLGQDRSGRPFVARRKLVPPFQESRLKLYPFNWARRLLPYERARKSTNADSSSPGSCSSDRGAASGNPVSTA